MRLIIEATDDERRVLKALIDAAEMYIEVQCHIGEFLDAPIHDDLPVVLGRLAESMNDI